MSSRAAKLAKLHTELTQRPADLGIVMRRLTADALPGHALHEDQDLWAENATGLRVGRVDSAGNSPVAPHQLGASKGLVDGLALKDALGIEVARLKIETILRAGGRWDKRRQCWALDAQGQRIPAESPILVDVQESQLEAVRWAADRIAALRDRRHVDEVVGLLYDDRRGGKTYALCVLMIAAALDVAALDGLPFEGWMVSQSHAARDEIDTLIRAILPHGSYTYRELPKRLYTLMNGAKIHCKTSDDPESLRVGKVDLIAINEGALQPQPAYEISLRGTQDRRGFCLIASNKPRSAKGAWVVRLVDTYERAAREGRSCAVRVIRVPPTQNAAISQAAKSAIAQAILASRDPDGDKELDEGLALEAGDFAYAPIYDDAKHRHYVIGGEDITHEVTRQLYGRPYDYVVGADFQRQCAAVAHKIFRVDDQWVLYIAKAWFLVDGGDENALAEIMQASDVSPANSLIIGDSSGAWQKGDHGYGPVSFEVFHKLGWAIRPPTDPKGDGFAKNPSVSQSVAKMRKLISDSRVAVSPGFDADPASVALRKCVAKKDAYGNLRPKGTHSHVTDCIRYVTWFLLSKGASATQAPLPSYVTRRR